jgi:tetratricopeptide (TPR) repeat protein
MAVPREKLIRNAEKFVSRGRIEAAIREYRKVLEDQPKDTGTLNRVGDLYARINSIDEAVRLFTQIAEQYTEEGFFVKAIAIYKKIIKLDPTRLGVYEKLAGLYHRQGLINEARTQYQVLADYYLKHDNAASAISIYLHMADLEPDDPAHRAKLAELYQQEKLNDKAMEQYQLIADVMLSHQRVDQAVQVLQRGLEVDPDDLDFLAMAVDKLRVAGHPEGAKQLLVAAKDKNPAAAGLLASVTAEEAEARGDDEGSRNLAPEKAPSAPPTLPLRPVKEESFDVGEIELPDLSGPDPLLDRDDALQRAMAEAEAAVSSQADGGQEDGFQDDLTSLEGEDILVEWDDATSESLIIPPPDMADLGPDVAGTGFTQEAEDGQEPEAEEEEEEQVELTGSWEIDLSELDLDGVAAEEDAQGEPAWDLPDPDAGEEALDLDIEPVPADDFDFGRRTQPEGSDEAEDEVEASDDWTSAEEVAEPLAEETLDLDDAFGEIPDFAIAAAEDEAGPDPQETSFEDMLSEAEVLAKYGLREKAYERVEQVLVVDAGHRGAHRVLIQLQLEDGNEPEVRRLAAELRRLSEAAADFEEWEKVEGHFAAAGFALEEKSKKKIPPKRPPKADRPTGDRIDRLLASLLDGDVTSPPKRKAKQETTEDLLSGLVGKLPAARPKKPAVAPPKPAPKPAPPPRPEVGEESVALGQPTPPPDVDFDDDSDIDDALAGMKPVFDIPALPPEQTVATDEPAAAVTGDFGDDTGTSWLDEVEAERQLAEGSEELFQEEEGFFDLAAELEEELTVSDALGPQQAGEQTLEEIVEGFKRGVEEHLSEEDYDTHFDLGIAYREMGLLDEAIGEFQLASKAPEHLASCCSMLGICFLDKGLPELAVKWYTRGLESPTLSEEDSLALLYDLGAVYLGTGDEENARKTFVEVYGIRSNYRDVAEQLEALDRG